MRQYALIKDDVITSIENLSNDDYSRRITSYQTIIDIEDMTNKPSTGWILCGNKFKPNNNFATIQDQVYDQQQRQRVFGESLSPVLVDMMGARNLKLSLDGTVVNVASLLNSLNAVKALLETGALKTARTVINSVTASFPAYADIFTYAVNEITIFLAENHYE
jgi:hypothetical protein